MNLLSESIARVEQRWPGLLPDLRRDDSLFITSDYSGHERTAEYEALAFLFCNPSYLGPWLQLRGQVRREFHNDGRRMSFKALNDRRRRAALVPFLHAANVLPGLLSVFLFRKGVHYFAEDRTNMALSARDRGWSTPAFERLLRTLTILSCLIAGLSRTGQDVHWYSDDDDILPNPSRINEVAEFLAIIATQFLDHQLGQLRVGTTQADVDRQLEDLVAISDLAAGALGNIAKEYLERGAFVEGLYVPAVYSKSKVDRILDWFSDSRQPLRRLVYLIEPGKKNGLRFSNIRFWNTADFH
jgi:hypothetical protein